MHPSNCEPFITSHWRQYLLPQVKADGVQRRRVGYVCVRLRGKQAAGRAVARAVFGRRRLRLRQRRDQHAHERQHAAGLPRQAWLPALRLPAMGLPIPLRLVLLVCARPESMRDRWLHS